MQYLKKAMQYLKRLFDFLGESGLYLTVAAICFAIGSVLVVGFTTWVYFPTAMEGTALVSWRPMYSGICLVVISAVIGVLALIHLKSTQPSPVELQYSSQMFGRALVGIGYFLLLDALLNIVAIAGFAKGGYEGAILMPLRTFSVETNTVGTAKQAPKLDPSTNTVPAAVPEKEGKKPVDEAKRNMFRAIQLMFALGFTLMGALFFFAKSLWDKMQDSTLVHFDERMFWAGLWFRLGEAVVFTLVVYVALRFKQQEGSDWLPFIALVIGLSVKSAENLIAGICERVLAAVNGLISK